MGVYHIPPPFPVMAFSKLIVSTRIDKYRSILIWMSSKCESGESIDPSNSYSGHSFFL